jgi:hypothetical protein
VVEKNVELPFRRVFRPTGRDVSLNVVTVQNGYYKDFTVKPIIARVKNSKQVNLRFNV